MFAAGPKKAAVAHAPNRSRYVTRAHTDPEKSIGPLKRRSGQFFANQPLRLFFFSFVVRKLLAYNVFRQLCFFFMVAKREIYDILRTFKIKSFDLFLLKSENFVWLHLKKCYQLLRMRTVFLSVPFQDTIVYTVFAFIIATYQLSSFSISPVPGNSQFLLSFTVIFYTHITRDESSVKSGRFVFMRSLRRAY